MEQTVLILIILAGVLLIPLVPAFVLYWMLPSKASVTGPLKGLNINLQGAFAGYFALFLVAAGLVQVWKPSGLDYELYQLSGMINLDVGPNETLDPRKVRIFLVPRSDSVEGPLGENQFRWSMKLPSGRKPDGGVSWPYDELFIEYPGLLTERVDISSGTIQANEARVRFDPVTLRRKPTDLPARQTVKLSDDN